MKRVLKYSLTTDAGPQTIQMPVGSFIVHTHAQGDRPVMWAEVDSGSIASDPLDMPVMERNFRVVATGEEITRTWQATYIGTVHIGWTVWHIYEVSR